MDLFSNYIPVILILFGVTVLSLISVFIYFKIKSSGYYLHGIKYRGDRNFYSAIILIFFIVFLFFVFNAYGKLQKRLEVLTYSYKESQEVNALFRDRIIKEKFDMLDFSIKDKFLPPAEKTFNQDLIKGDYLILRNLVNSCFDKEVSSELYLLFDYYPVSNKMAKEKFKVALGLEKTWINNPVCSAILSSSLFSPKGGF